MPRAFTLHTHSRRPKGGACKRISVNWKDDNSSDVVQLETVSEVMSPDSQGRLVAVRDPNSWVIDLDWAGVQKLIRDLKSARDATWGPVN